MRRTIAVLAVATAGIPTAASVGVAAAQQAAGTAAAAAPRFTRVDTDAEGEPESVGGQETGFLASSGNGRYALFAARTDSNMIPEAHRTSRGLGHYLVRKDLWSGAITLVSVDENGAPLVADWRTGAMSPDGTAFAYGTGDKEEPSLFHRDLASGARRVTTLPWRWYIEHIRLSADGRWLTWAGLGEEGHNVISRHDVTSGETTELLKCNDPFDGCTRTSGMGVSDDATKFLIKYQPQRGEALRSTILDTTTGELRALPEDVGHTLSGDGRWIFYAVRSGEYRFELKKLSTAPGATPVVLRTWEEDSLTWSVGVRSTNPTGTLVGYYWLSRDPNNFAASRTYLYDLRTGRETTLPEPRRGVADVIGPHLSRDSRIAVVKERCPWTTDCGPIGWYAIRLSDLHPHHN
ncbi:hypothetical protein [Saccharothrix algeriensis]|uniref:WD40 repeat protein n=1 Tax=Saccharothrix algeriensis TaxID=173560 RepID=A0ABS2SFD8_9PSEU|nr:hypothetical protein [Saccharothrix algeriensis]MBM7814981.1 hypothetical protein [Saccharothrix algeriensis]